jgi:DNA-3-methyladenine glycosylase II
VRFEIEPGGPFNLAAARQYFGGWLSPADEPDAVLMAFPVEGWQESAAVVLRQRAGLVEGSVSAEDAAGAWQQALAAVSLDFDGSGFAEVGEHDPVIGRLQAEYEMMRPVCFYTPYEAAAHFLIGHRLSIAQARSLRARLAEQHGDAVHGGHAFPRPQVLLELESFGPIAGEKMERLHGIAAAALTGQLDRARLRSLPVGDALTELRQLRGVGPFIAEGILLRGAGMVDEVPADEVTLQAIQRAYELPALPSRAEVLAIAEHWRPYRMWCSVLLHLWLRSGVAGSFRPVGSGRRPRSA